MRFASKSKDHFAVARTLLMPLICESLLLSITDRASSSTVQCTYKYARFPEQWLKPSVFCMHSIKKGCELSALHDCCGDLINNFCTICPRYSQVLPPFADRVCSSLVWIQPVSGEERVRWSNPLRRFVSTGLSATAPVVSTASSRSWASSSAPQQRCGANTSMTIETSKGLTLWKVGRGQTMWWQRPRADHHHWSVIAGVNRCKWQCNGCRGFIATAVGQRLC